MTLETLSLKRNLKSGPSTVCTDRTQPRIQKREISKVLRCTLLKKTITGRCQPLQKVGVNYMGGGSALPTDSKKNRANKLTVINVNRPSDVSTVGQNLNRFLK